MTMLQLIILLIVIAVCVGGFGLRGGHAPIVLGSGISLGGLILLLIVLKLFGII